MGQGLTAGPHARLRAVSADSEIGGGQELPAAPSGQRSADKKKTRTDLGPGLVANDCQAIK
jgi:hypothetical protein